MSKRKPTFLKEENLLTLLSQNNLIIPEIQREYVWGENEKVLTGFLKDLKNKIGTCCQSCALPTAENKINIGFLYSYKPDYVKIEHERFLDENIIDGQQRITTLFLLLFFCALKEKRKGEFLSLIRFEEKIRMSFDFKVRDLTKRFLLELVEKVETLDYLKEIDKQTWFLEDYKTDVSIKAMLKAIQIIQILFSDNTRYFNYLINYVVFWHFKTEATSQGEELYITMNARGEELAGNEVAKAALMLASEDLFEWGSKWEEWQQFFWKNRNKAEENPSADKGFNGFLNCILGLESFLLFPEWVQAERRVPELLTLEKVETYYSAFRYLCDNKNEFKKNYSYCNWVDKCLSEIWNLFNNSDMDWLGNYKDDKKGTAISRMVYIWSVLHYLLNRENKEDITEAFRVLRLFYIRHHNYNRSITGLQENVNQIINDGLWHIISGSTEEIQKHKYLSTVDPDDLIGIEEIIWQIEDHPLNLNGTDAGALNCSHLIDFESTPSASNLKRIQEKFYGLFPLTNNDIDYLNVKKLLNILLFYGPVWEQVKPDYYSNLWFGNWRKIIRKIKIPENVFTNFFKEYLEKSIDEIYQEKVRGFDLDKLTIDTHEQLKWYASKIGEEMWDQGLFIAIGHYKYPENDLNFTNTRAILNTKGNLQGGEPALLSDLI